MAPTPRDAALEAPVREAFAGPPFASWSDRRRRVGRIGGWTGTSDAGAVARLERALGAGAQVLARVPAPGARSGEAGDRTLVADWDCCWLGGTRITSLQQWHEIVRSERLAEVSGAFVIAFLRDDGALTLARDAIGERTLYYTCSKDGILFGSTMRSLLATGLVGRTLHLPAVAGYLTYAYVPGSETLIAGVRELLPGEVIEWHGTRPVYSRLWLLPAEPEDTAAADEEALRRDLRLCLEEAVRARLSPGEPTGAFLSGGLDSSLVVALACALHDRPVHTYSVSFGAGYANELPFSSLVAAHCGTVHRIVELSPPVVLHHLDETIALLGDPIGDPLTVPNAILFREAAAEVGVIFNGEGGDPCFGGPKNIPMLLSELFGNGEEWSRERSYLRAHQKCFDDLGAMLAPVVCEALAADPLEARVAPYLNDPRRAQYVARLMAINVTFKGAHHILPKIDALSAPFGVVPRSPLFDRDVVAAAFRIPPQLKLRGSVEKYLLKQAVRDLLPPAIITRPKSGMLVPVESWFQGPLLPHARERLLDGLSAYGLIDRAYLERLLAGRIGGLRPRRGAKIWLLVTLEAWLRALL